MSQVRDSGNVDFFFVKFVLCIEILINIKVRFLILFDLYGIKMYTYEPIDSTAQTPQTNPDRGMPETSVRSSSNRARREQSSAIIPTALESTSSRNRLSGRAQRNRKRSTICTD